MIIPEHVFHAVASVHQISYNDQAFVTEVTQPNALGHQAGNAKPSQAQAPAPATFCGTQSDVPTSVPGNF